MNQQSSTTKKYYPTLIGAALLAASLFHFSLPVFSAGTDAGQVIRNTATGTYDDEDGNSYTIDSNTVEVTVAKVAGITNIPIGFVDETTGTDNNSVLTDDTVSFIFEITNVGNHTSNIFIPSATNLATKGLDPNSLTVEISTINPSDTFDFDDATDYSRPADGIVGNVPINGKILVRVQGEVTATAAGAPIEVRLGDTAPNTDINAPVPETQNQFDDGNNGDVLEADNEVRTTAVAPAVDINDPNEGTLNITTAPEGGEKEASSVRQVFLGSNPLAAVKIEKTLDTIADGATAALNDNIINYDLELEVLTATPSSLFTPGQLEGRDFGARMPSGNVSIGDASNLVLVSDAIPADTELNGAISGFTDAAGRVWTPVYAEGTEPGYIAGSNIAADQITWVLTPTDLTDVTRVGWVYNADSSTGAIDPGTTISGFTFDVETTGLDATTGGSVANIAQIFGSTVNGPEVFDESGDQDPSNFNGANPGPSETAEGSTGIADPAEHGVDSENNNNANGVDPQSPGGEDNVVTIGAAGTLINGPVGQPAATGNIYGQGPDNDHDFQNKGISNFETSFTAANPQQGGNDTLDPAPVVFNNTLSNPGTTDLSDVLLQPINPEFNDFSGDPADTTGGEDGDLPAGTKVTINLGTQQAIYTYTEDASGATPTYSFVLDGNTAANPSQAITIPTLAAGVPLDYSVTIDLPTGTELSTDVEHGFAVPIIAFVDGDNDGTPDSGENSNYTVNQVYTGFVKITKQVRVLQPDGTVRTGMDFGALDTAKLPLPGDTLEYRVNYRNISEPQSGNGNNGILNGVNVMIDENGTLDNITETPDVDRNNWGLDNNGDNDLDTINVQGSATDSNGGAITYYTGATDPTSGDKYSVETLTSAGTTDPGDTVTGYRSTVPLLAPSAQRSIFSFQRKVDEFDGLAQDIDNLP
ncbi:MAG: hypothetical protein AAGK10_16035 [Cyanobacteria bacterium J06555_3]